MSKLSNLVENTIDRWSREAELAFCMAGKKGLPMFRRVWANGETMVGFEGARSNQYVPLARAIELYREGWKIQEK